MNHTLKNQDIAILVNSLGAELKSLVKKSNNTEYLWQGDPEWWGRSAPVLFPIVGRVKNNIVNIDGKQYHLSQHGFARDREFVLVEKDESSLHFRLSSNEVSKRYLPWDFNLNIIYRLEDVKLHIKYIVENTGTETMYFSLGAHPGFNIPDGKMSQCMLIFEEKEKIERRLIKDGYFTGETQPMLNHENTLRLDKALFNHDALIFDGLKSKSVELTTLESEYNVKVSWEGFPYLGIWSQKNCERFVCIEPWHGLADPVTGHDDFKSKEGIIALAEGESRVFALKFEI